MTERRRAPRPAVVARTFVTGGATALSLGMVAAMGLAAGATTNVADDPAGAGTATALSAPATDADATPSTIQVIVRRHLPVDHGVAPTVQQVMVPSVTTTRAPARAPAPRPRTRSGGS